MYTLLQGKTDMTAKHFSDQVHLSNFKCTNGITIQFQATYSTTEVKSSDFNIQELVASDTTAEQLESSQKQGLVAVPEEFIQFYSKHLEVSKIPILKTWRLKQILIQEHLEMLLDPAT